MLENPRIAFLGPFPGSEDGDYCISIFHLPKKEVEKLIERVNHCLKVVELPHLSWTYDEASRTMSSEHIPGTLVLRVAEKFLKILIPFLSGR